MDDGVNGYFEMVEEMRTLETTPAGGVMRCLELTVMGSTVADPPARSSHRCHSTGSTLWSAPNLKVSFKNLDLFPHDYLSAITFLSQLLPPSLC